MQQNFRLKIAEDRFRPALILSVCQALYTSSVSIDLTLTGIVGYQLADDKALATLPFAAITVTAACVTVFASLLMRRIGRRNGFLIGAAFAAAGGLISVHALYQREFWEFCLGTATVGVFQAFAQYYRLAAADAVEPDAKGSAISIVLTGGVVAAVLGPLLAVWSKNLLSPVLFAGSYALVTMLGLASLMLVALFLPRNMETRATAANPDSRPARSLHEIAAQPAYLAAVCNNVFGYAVMMLVMTVAPIAAVHYGHGIAAGASIIEWHLVGMFAPSFFSAWLIKRIGLPSVLLTGVALCAACSLLALAGTSLPIFYIALLSLGVGWNFMYVGGTTLLAQSYRQSERAKAQAVSEFSTYGAAAVSSLVAGALLAQFGWATVNTILLVILIIPTAATLFWMAEKWRAGRMEHFGPSDLPQRMVPAGSRDRTDPPQSCGSRHDCKSQAEAK